jgi:hypothetical protein
VTMEQISGPWDGIYIAAYTAELDGRFYGYVKLSVSKPADVWTAQVMMKLTARASYREESEALEAVEKRALRVIANLRSTPDGGFWAALFAPSKKTGKQLEGV